MHDDVEGMIAEFRLREISDQIVQLKMFLDSEPNNIILINLLQHERDVIKKNYIRVVPDG